jgi:hypothetical protein
MNPETHIEFTVGDYPSCTAQPGHQYSVSLSILNLLSQLTAIPVLEGGSGSVAGGQQMKSLPLRCGMYTAYWNGKVLGSQQEAASGVYQYVLVVDGHKFAKKMIVGK